MLTTVLFLGSIGFWEIVLLVLVFLLLFGGKKIPELMEGLGKGVKSFRKGVNAVEKEVDEVKKEIESTAEEEEKKDE